MMDDDQSSTFSDELEPKEVEEETDLDGGDEEDPYGLGDVDENSLKDEEDEDDYMSSVLNEKYETGEYSI